MTLITQVDTATLRSDADRALYHVLRNLALYKSFNDSLDENALSAATDYFLEEKDYFHASLSLYLQGNLNIAKKEFSKAAVCLIRSSEIASRIGDIYREGFCAMYIWEVYGKIHDSGRQIEAAKRAVCSFDSINRRDWKIYALLNLSSAYNNRVYHDSLLIAGAILWIRSIGRRRLYERLEFMRDVNTLTESLKSQTNRNAAIAENIAELSQSIKELLSSKACDSRAALLGLLRERREKIANEIKYFIESAFSTTEIIDGLSHTIDRHAHNLYSNFKRDFPNLKDRDYHLFIFSVSGLTAPAISIILGESKEIIYNRNSRLRLRMKNSGVADAELYLSYMS